MTNHTYVKKQLALTGMSRQELAAQIGVSKRTIDNWLSSGLSIPETKMCRIRAVFSGGMARKPLAFDDVLAFPVRMTPHEYEMFKLATGCKSEAQVEAKIREILQAKWDELATAHEMEFDDGDDNDGDDTPALTAAEDIPDD